MTTIASNADPAELAKFGALASRWWDTKGDFKPLHQINPVRLRWIDQHAQLQGKRALDVGCGGGILTEAMAALGADVVGIDLSEKPLAVAKLHLFESGQKVDYRLLAAEALAASEPESFDVVTCMEMLEHVPDPQSIINACAQLAKPGAPLFFSTINRNPKSFAFAIVGAEYVLRLLPKGTHEYERFITPAELASGVREAGLVVDEIIGMHYNPFTGSCRLDSDPSVNYLLRAHKPL